MKVSVFFAWYDLWVGAYWDRDQRILYICPLPMIVIKTDLSRLLYKRYVKRAWANKQTAMGYGEWMGGPESYPLRPPEN